MGTNTKKGYRIGVVSKRSQLHNETTGQYIKRDTTTGRFLSVKKSAYKGVRLERNKKDESSSQSDPPIKNEKSERSIKKSKTIGSDDTKKTKETKKVHEPKKNKTIKN